MNGEYLATIDVFINKAALSGMMEERLNKQECIQNLLQYNAVTSVPHQDKTKAVPNLCRLHPSLRLRMLDNDSKRPYLTINLSFRELKKNKKSILAN